MTKKYSSFLGVDEFHWLSDGFHRRVIRHFADDSSAATLRRPYRKRHTYFEVKFSDD
jgi:hypothetical protein